MSCFFLVVKIIHVQFLFLECTLLGMFETKFPEWQFVPFALLSVLSGAVLIVSWRHAVPLGIYAWMSKTKHKHKWTYFKTHQPHNNVKHYLMQCIPQLLPLFSALANGSLEKRRKKKTMPFCPCLHFFPLLQTAKWIVLLFLLKQGMQHLNIHNEPTDMFSTTIILIILLV